jgi:hypothetical protein
MTQQQPVRLEAVALFTCAPSSKAGRGVRWKTPTRNSVSAPHGTAFLTDASILQRYVELCGQLKRVMSVIKLGDFLENYEGS